ncbi:hypothetical protein ACIQVK_51285 [Streptomyces sp. NPDC090493]|uniref:hypothetical protein n=1 Tax=Streptomyces sp. NPDC090493 TaxID=3365964 RepID=UPI00380774BA
MDGRDDLHGPEAPKEDVKDTATAYDGPLDPSVPEGSAAITGSGDPDFGTVSFTGGSSGIISAPGSDFSKVQEYLLHLAGISDDTTNMLLALPDVAAGGWPTAYALAAQYANSAQGHVTSFESLSNALNSSRDNMGVIGGNYAKTSDVTAAQVEQAMTPTASQIPNINGTAAGSGSGGKSDT